MSFGPTKNKSLTKGSNHTDLNHGDNDEESKQVSGGVRSKLDERSRHSQSIRSQSDIGINERFSQLSNDIARMQQQQDSFTELLSMKSQFDQMQQDQSLVHTLSKKVNQMGEHIANLEARFDKYQLKTEKFLVVLDQNIDEESKIREKENKIIKKVNVELERRQNEIEYDLKLDIKNSEIHTKRGLVAVTSKIDQKVEAYKEFFEENVDSVHKNLKNNIVKDEDRLNNLHKKLDDSEETLAKRVKNLETSMLPSIKTANKRRKVDYEDLKAWLLESIDSRLNAKEEKLERTVKKNMKSTVLKQNNEIISLKKEFSVLSSASPGGRASQLYQESQYEHSEQKLNEDGKEERKSEIEASPNFNTGKY